MKNQVSWGMSSPKDDRRPTLDWSSQAIFIQCWMQQACWFHSLALLTFRVIEFCVEVYYITCTYVDAFICDKFSESWGRPVARRGAVNKRCQLQMKMNVSVMPHAEDTGSLCCNGWYLFKQESNATFLG